MGTGLQSSRTISTELRNGKILAAAFFTAFIIASIGPLAGTPYTRHIFCEII